MLRDPWARGIAVALLHVLLPFLCRPIETLHQTGDVTRTCVACGKTTNVPPSY